MSRTSPVTILANTFWTDNETIRDHSYQPGRYSVPLYDINDRLLCVSRRKPVANEAGYTFVPCEDRLQAESGKHGTVVWEYLQEG